MVRRPRTSVSATDDRGDVRDYPVGRAKPPKHSQFKPGTSGNPGGRRRGSINMKSIWSEVAETEITIVEKGVPTTVTVPKAIVLRLVQQALKGDIRAINSSVEHFERHCAPEPGNRDEEDLSREDQALLDRAEKHHLCRAPRRTQSGPGKSRREAAGSAKANGDDDC